MGTDTAVGTDDDTETRPAGRQRLLAGLAGVTAAAVGLAIGEITAGFTAERGAPLSAVGEWVIRHAPSWGTELAIDWFGTHDKTALQTGTTIVLLAFAAAVGVAASYRLVYGLAGVAVITAAGVGAALTLQGEDSSVIVPSLVAGVAAGAALWGLLEWLKRMSADAADFDDPGLFGRRRFIFTGVVAMGAAAVGGYVGRQVAKNSAVNAAREDIALPRPADPAPPLSADVDLNVPELTSYHTPNSEFYRIDTALVTPKVDPSGWELRIFGRVDRELTLTYDELLARPMIERDITLCCVSNTVGGDLIGNARWLGVPLADLLDEVSPHPGADQLVARSTDGFTAGAPTELCLDGRDAMLAVGMNGEPLPIDHGFPVRMVVPGLYGYVSATKWLTELELTSFDDYDAYWIERSWSLPEPVKTQSRIDTPRRRASAGTVPVAGVAWAQHRGISAVEVQVDDGPWRAADLSTMVSGDTWRQWVYQWDAAPGEHRLTVRATDGDGVVQTADEASPHPSGATGWHSVTIDVE